MPQMHAENMSAQLRNSRKYRAKSSIMSLLVCHSSSSPRAGIDLIFAILQAEGRVAPILPHNTNPHAIYACSLLVSLSPHVSQKTRL